MCTSRQLLSVLSLAIFVTSPALAEPADGRARLVDIGGGTRMYLDCVGTGAPTVVIDGGAGHWSVHYRHVQETLAADTRVCTYDRVGLGQSDMVGGPRTSSRMADELHRLLAAADERGPFVLVGHSLGGYNVRIYEHRYASEVAALVLLDSGHPQQWESLPQVWAMVEASLPMMQGAAELATLGQLELAHLPPWDDRYAPDARADYEAVAVQPKVQTTIWQEMASSRLSGGQVPARTASPLPVIVASAGRSFDAFAGTGIAIEEANDAWSELQSDLTTISSHAEQMISPAHQTSGAAAAPNAQTWNNCRFERFDELNLAAGNRFPAFWGHARCGTVDVPLDHTGAISDERLEVHYIVLPATDTNQSGSPLFIFAGGPGDAVTSYDWAPIYFAEPRRLHDIVLVEQRGTGRTAPLACASMERTTPEALLAPALIEVEVVACRRDLEQQHDLRFFRTVDYADDINLVREALGYNEINLWGGSYGTRVALTYLRRHPATARAAVLQGVVHTFWRYPLFHAAAGERAVGKLAEACNDDPACAEQFGDLTSTVRALAALFEDGSVTVDRKWEPGADSRALKLRLPVFLDWVRSQMYRSRAAVELPGLLSAARATGNLSEVAARIIDSAAGFGEGDNWFSGLWLNIVCAEDDPLITEPMIREHTGGTVFGDHRVRAQQMACRNWPTVRPPEGYAEFVRSDRPVLMITGDYDPVTPPSAADEALIEMSDARHVVGAYGHVLDTIPCVGPVIAQFLATADPGRVDASCVEDLQLPDWVHPSE